MRVLGFWKSSSRKAEKNAYWFQKYTETKYLPVPQIDAFREDLYKQDSPEKDCTSSMTPS